MVLLLGGAVVAGSRMLETPDLSPVASTPVDGTRAQQKLFEVARGTKGPDRVTLTEAEVNALLTRHLVQARGVRLGAPSVRLIGDDRFVLDAQSPVRRLLEEISLRALADVLPARWENRPLWVHVGARVHIVDGRRRRQVRADVDEFAIGRQALPPPLLRVLLDPASVGLLEWPLPDHVERVAIEPGRVVIRTASPR
jgi:hypothetical protein